MRERSVRSDFARTLLFVSALGISGCSEPGPLLFPPAASMAVSVPPSVTELQVGDVLPGGFTLRILDTRGNPTEGKEAVVDVIGGGGQLPVQTLRSDAQGEIRVLGWRMGTVPIENRLRVSAPGIEPVEISIQARPGRPAALRSDGDALPVGTVGELLPAQLPMFRIEDRFGNPVPDVLVRFSTPQGGAIDPIETRTDASGNARPLTWTLGPGAGDQSFIATVDGAQIVLRTEARPGPVSQATWVQGEGVRSEIGMIIPVRFAVADRFGNGIEGHPVTFRVTAGGGTVSGSNTETDSRGEAAPERWQFGSAPGANALEALAQGFPPQTVTAQAMAPDWTPEGRSYRVRAAHVNQGTQTLTGTVPLIPGRPGLLRIFVEASEPNAPLPEVRVTLHQGGIPLRTLTTRRPTLGSAPTETLESGLTQSWDVVLPEDLITLGLEWTVAVDPDHEVPVVTRRWSSFPENGGRAAPPFQPMPEFRVRFIPLRDTQTGNTGDLTPANLPNYMEATRRMLPLGADTVYIGTTFTTSLYSADGRIRSVLNELRVVWLAAPHRDEYYHGIFPGSGPLAFSGIAYRPSNPRSPAPIAMSSDRFPGAPFTVAHEFGHNFGVRHAPCGNPAGPDPLYPYFDATLGVVGWDRGTNTLMSPSGNRDLMSYCSPRWVSDYNYLLMMSWRLEAPAGVSGVGVPAERPSDGVLIWGQIGSEGVTLEPVVSLRALPFLPTGEGPYLLEVLGSGGTLLFGSRFTPDPVPHSDDPNEAHFGFVLPLDPQVRAQLIEIRVSGPSGTFSRKAPSEPLRSAVGLGAGSVAGSEVGFLAPGTGLDQTLNEDAITWRYSAGTERSPDFLGSSTANSAGRVPSEANARPTGVEWDPSVFPLVVVFDASNGEIVGMDRSGVLDLTGWSVPIELRFSDGLRGWRAELGRVPVLH